MEESVTANQPIQVVAVRFTPEGRTEPVVAVDLIDGGSVSNLHEGVSVPLNYEGLSPRTAYIQESRRNFPSRNIAALGTTAIAVSRRLPSRDRYENSSQAPLLRAHTRIT
jgi:hypothetical protein